MAAGRRVAGIGAAAFVLLAAGCGHHARAGVPPVQGRDWRAVVNDWEAHGRFAEQHACADVVVARAAAASLQGTPLKQALNVYERRICRSGNVWAVRVGMSNADVAATAGAPIPWRSGPHCWSYHATKPGTSVDAVTFCFDRTGRVAQIKTGVHA